MAVGFGQLGPACCSARQAGTPNRNDVRAVHVRLLGSVATCLAEIVPRPSFTRLTSATGKVAVPKVDVPQLVKFLSDN